MAQLAAGQPAAEADLKTLEAKISEKLEVTAKQVVASAALFQRAMEEISRATSMPQIAGCTGYGF